MTFGSSWTAAPTVPARWISSRGSGAAPSGGAAVGVGRWGSVVAAVAAAAVSAVVLTGWGSTRSMLEPLTPAGGTGTITSASRPVPDTLEANQRFLEAIRSSGLSVDYQPMDSPAWAVSDGRQVLAGEVSGVRARGDDVVVTVQVRQAIPDAHVAGRVDAVLRSGTLRGLTAADLDLVSGPVLLALPDQPLPADPAPEVWPYSDGFWLAVPDGIGNPYVDYSEMRSGWPAVNSIEELAGVLERAATMRAEETSLPIECSASWQNPPTLDDTGLTPAAFETAVRLGELAMSCDSKGLTARALADGTQVTVAHGDVAEQLGIPDDSGAYIRLVSALAFPVASEPGLHAFEVEGWRVVIASDGRWVEFSHR